MDTSHTGTCETMSLTHWINAVVIEAARVGAGRLQPRDRPAPGACGELARAADVRARLHRAFIAGEPVWMAASEFLHLVMQKPIIQRAEAEARHIASLVPVRTWR